MHHEKKLPNYVNPVNTHLFLRVRLTYSLCLILMLANAVTLSAQDDDISRPRRGSRIIDDTTKQIYGPTTSKYYFERDVFYNQKTLFPIDTVIRNFHRYNYVQRNENFYQDLGVIGTSMNPIFYQAPDLIGVRSGFHTYDLYWDREQIRYFDTKSPYSNMHVILGGKGRSITRATFSRNINPRWNFGLTYRGLFIDKQIQRSGKGDRVARGHYYDFYTAYQSKDSAYSLYSNFRRLFHQVDEFGGVRVGDSFLMEDFFKINIQPNLTAAESNDLRMNFHLFHQYSIGRGLQLYHTADRYRQGNAFIDFKNQEPGYYDELVSDSIRDVTKFKTFRNEAGIKGNLLKLFYNGYYAIRNYSMSYQNLEVDTISTKGTENYFGGRMSLRLDSLGEVSGWAEINLNDGNYVIDGRITSRWFEAGLRQQKYKPGFAERSYVGGRNQWENSFDDIESSQINGFLHYRSRTFNISPGLALTRLHNYIFYRADTVVLADTVVRTRPIQSNGDHFIVSPELKLSITLWRHLTLSNHIILTEAIDNSNNAIRIPRIFANSQLSYSNIFFNGNLDMHAGVDMHWKSDYKAHGYDFVIRQFYIQNDFLIKAFPIVDVFFNAKIKRARIFVKYNNLVQAITKKGYLPTPYYPGQRPVLDFGFDWSFYD